MPRVHYSAIQDRFTHIDAQFVACRLGLPDDDAFFAVRFYPWWEHPGYVEARRAGNNPWRFSESENGAKEVRVYPRGIVACKLTRYPSVTDWYFTERGPFLWPHEPTGQLFVNDPIDREALFGDIAQRLTTQPARVAAWFPLDLTPPVSCRLPHSLLGATIEALDARDVDHLVTYQPEPGPAFVAFVIDDGNYIVAEDFELDVPEFEHRPEWFEG